MSQRARILTTFFLLAILSIFFLFLYKIYIPRIAAFGCFDDCFNYGAGYFITKGKHLYSEIFFNHQPFPAFISAAIQQTTRPENIYALLLRHRQFILLFGFIWEILLIIRFGMKGLGFAILYETTKFYIFGDRFLAEGMIVYPFVYMIGTFLKPSNNEKMAWIDVAICTISTWFILFMREPYVPAALFIFCLVLIFHPYKKSRVIFFLLFVFLAGLTMLLFPLSDYYENVVTINRQTILLDSLRDQKTIFPGIIISFAYPIVLLFG